jgi:hypothetical protein
VAQEGLDRLAQLGIDLGKSQRWLADNIPPFTHRLGELQASYAQDEGPDF